MSTQKETWKERHDVAQRHVAEGQRVIERQRALIRRQQEAGRDTKDAEQLLATFERSQVLFEDDLARIRAEPKS
jgi:hypothetical protein